MTFYMVGVSLSISLNLKLAPVPYATPKLPIQLVKPKHKHANDRAILGLSIIPLVM